MNKFLLGLAVFLFPTLLFANRKTDEEVISFLPSLEPVFVPGGTQGNVQIPSQPSNTSIPPTTQPIDPVNIGFYPIVDSFEIRNDGKGQGHFGASRGSRSHAGIDVVCLPGEVIYSPIEGYVNRDVNRVYASDPNYQGIEITGTGKHQGLKVKMFYCSRAINLNDEFFEGTPVAFAQDISEKYGPSMIPHIHLEVRLNGQLTDPLNYYQNLV